MKNKLTTEDIETMKRLAKEQGYEVHGDDKEIYFVDPKQFVDAGNLGMLPNQDFRNKVKLVNITAEDRIEVGATSEVVAEEQRKTK